MNKILAVIGTIICVLIAAALIKVLVSFTGFKRLEKNINNETNAERTSHSFSWNNSVTTTSHEYSFPAVDKVQSVKVELASESITLVKTSGNEIKVSLLGDWTNITPHVDLIGSELTIKAERNLKLLPFNNRSVKIEIPAYKNNFLEVECETASGSIHLNDIESREIELFTASGSIKLVNCTANEADINTASGSITFEDCSFTEAEAKTASGSMHFTDCTIPSLEAKSASGSVHISGAYDKLDIHSSSGSIHADLEKPLVDDSCFDCTSGSINLKLPKQSEFRLKYKCNSGTMKNEFTGTDGKSGTDVCGLGNTLIEAYTTSGSIRINKN